MPKSVDEWLNDVDYSFKDYTPSEDSIRYLTFVRLAMADALENETPLVHYKVCDEVFNPNKKNTAILCHRGLGKCLDIESKIVTPDGYKLMKDIEVGDVILDRNNKQTKVTYTSPVFYDKECYKFLLEDGSEFICSHDHKHILHKRLIGRSYKDAWNERILTTDEIIENGVSYDRKIGYRNPKGRETKWYIPINTQVIVFNERSIELDAYTLGVFLGNGNFKRETIVGYIDDIYEIASNIPFEIKSGIRDKRNLNITQLRFKDLYKYIGKYKNMIGESKEIPEEYIYNSIDIRLGMLRGLLDTGGTVDKNGYVSFTNKSLKLCQGLMEIIRSLGGYCRFDVKHNKKLDRDYYQVYIYLNNYKLFNLKRKQDRCITFKDTLRVGILDIVKIDNTPVKCISVDSSTESYQFNGNYITHNTTICAEMVILYIAAFGEFPGLGKVDFMLYVGDSIENGVKNLRKNIEYRYENSEYLQKLIPNISIKNTVQDSDDESIGAIGRKFTDVRLEFRNNRGNKLVVRSYGALTGVRGAKEMGKRPQLAIIDDILSDEDARSETNIKTIENTVHKAVKYALLPKGSKMIWLGTPFNAKDPLYKVVESGAWNVAVYPICEKFPCSKDEFRGSWEDRFDYEYVKQAYDESISTGQVESFNQELMLRVMSADDRLIDDNDIVWYPSSYIIRSNKHLYNFYITTDLATSEKSSSDFSVISVWAINNNKDWILVDGKCTKQMADKTIDDIFMYSQMYNPLGVGIEVTGQQGGFVSWLKSEMLKRNIYFRLLSSNNNGAEGIRPISDKFSRFLLFTPRFKQKKMWFPEDIKETQWGREFINEITKVGTTGFKSKHDDVLDTISMLGSFEAYAPSHNSDVDLFSGKQLYKDSESKIIAKYYGDDLTYQDNDMLNANSSTLF